MSRNACLSEEFVPLKCESNENFALTYIEDSRFGLFRGYKASVIDSSGNLLKTFYPFCFHKACSFRIIDKNRFITREACDSKSEFISEFYLYDYKEKKSSKMFSFKKGEKLNDIVVVPSNNNSELGKIYIIAVLEGNNGYLTLVSVDKGNRIVLPLTSNAVLRGYGKEFMIFSDGLNPIKNVLVKYDGSYQGLERLNNMVITAVTENNTLLAMVPNDYNGNQDGMKSIVEINLEKAETKTVFESNYPFYSLRELSYDRKFVVFHIFESKGKNAKSKTFAVNLGSGDVIDFVDLNKTLNDDKTFLYCGFFPVTGSIFYFGIYSEKGGFDGIIEIDASTGKTKKVVSMGEILQQAKKCKFTLPWLK